MVFNTWSVQKAKTSFSAMVEAARRTPQTVTKHGEPMVVVMTVEEYTRLCNLERRAAPSFKEHLLSMPKDDGRFDRLEVHFRDIDL